MENALLILDVNLEKNQSKLALYANEYIPNTLVSIAIKINHNQKKPYFDLIRTAVSQIDILFKEWMVKIESPLARPPVKKY
jgi:hypothetical protein